MKNIFDFIKNNLKYLAIPLLIVVIYFSLFYRLGYENINVDQFLWYERTEKFFKAIQDGKFKNTYQQYHPGVTLMYLIGLGQFSYKTFTGDESGFIDVPYQNFWLYNFHTKLYVVLFCLAIILLSTFLIFKITKSRKFAFIFLFLLMMESYYVGVLRNLHMDGLVSVLIFSSVLSFYVACSEKKVKYFVLAGVLTGLGLLTKSVALITFLFCFLIFIFFFFKGKGYRIKYLLLGLMWVVISVTMFFALFPAMWVQPGKTIKKIVNDGVVETGVSGAGFKHYIGGKMVVDPGETFYVNVLKFRVTPVLQFLVTLYFVFFLADLITKRKNDGGLLLFLSVLFFAIYVFAFTKMGKKTDRYLSSVYPFLAFVGPYVLYRVFGFLESKRVFIGIKIILFLIMLVPFSYYVWNANAIKPYYMAYYNDFFGGIPEAEKVIYLNQGGIAAYEINSFLNTLNLPDDPQIAIRSKKEVRRVSKYELHYPDVLKIGTYDVAVVPLQRDNEFKKNLDAEHVIKIKGYDYWKIYFRSEFLK